MLTLTGTGLNPIRALAIRKIAVLFQNSKNHNSVNFCRRLKVTLKVLNCHFLLKNIEKRGGYKFDGRGTNSMGARDLEKCRCFFNFPINHNSFNFCRTQKKFLQKKFWIIILH